MKVSMAVALGLATLCAAGCGDSNVDASLVAPAVTTRKVTVSGRLLLDEHGREVILRGFNAGGRAKMPPFLPFDVDEGEDVAEVADAYFARIAALGANLIRLTFSWEALEPTRGAYSQAYLDQYRTVLDAAYANGFFVIVDFHQDVFASPFCGDGFPLWALGDIPHGEPRYDCGFPDWAFPALDPESDVSAAYDRLWFNDDGLQDDMEAMWRVVAAEYAGHPAVAGFEVINEPGSGSVPIETFESETLPALFARMGAAIREEAGDYAIFGGGRAGDALGLPNHLTEPDLEDFVFAPHYYDPVAVLNVQATDVPRIHDGIVGTLEPASRWDVPVILGEFGTQNDYEFKAEHMDILYDELDLASAHGAAWEASQTGTYWNTEDFSVLDTDGSEQAWADVAVRAYPRAIAGHIERFLWTAETATFELSVSAAREGVSEIYLPQRHLGARPRIVVSGARYRFDAETSVLLVAAEPGASYTVTVR